MTPVRYGRAPPAVQLRNVVARRLVRLVRLAVDKRDLHFLRLATMHYDHHLSAISVTYRMWQSGLERH